MKTPILLTVYALFALSSSATTSKDGLDVPVKFKACKSDSECVKVPNDCAGCCQYDAINAALKTTYEKRLKDVCSSYHGSVCECCGPDYQLKCLKSKCTLVEVPGSRKAKCGQ